MLLKEEYSYMKRKKEMNIIDTAGSYKSSEQNTVHLLWLLAAVTD